ncbi:MAG TPA: hypothetical protein VN048_09515 [Verrucomicrobiae bacterium]|jgi:hypothetical protein|nr:hypothetical protein [Verrucomicrobiae bacterium]
MSFDVFLTKFLAGMPAESNRDAVLAVLNKAKFQGPDEHGFYVVEFADGHSVEFSAGGLQGEGEFNDCAFHIRGMSPDLVRFVFEIAKAGDMVMMPATEDFVPILSLPGQQNELPKELAENEIPPVLCGSPEELWSLLSGGYEGWKKYRDQVVGDNRDP